MTTLLNLSHARRLSVAPMMDWTDRHCRYLHRLLSRNTLLYTEMVTAAAVVHGDRDRLLAFNDEEHPVALQLGGSDPDLLADAIRAAAPFGYAEYNLNVGCPSDRVQSGAFGACLMREADLVARCCAAMQAAAGDVPVTVKCRIGVDDQIPADVLPAFIDTVAEAGVETFVIHARMAWLEGLSPKQNREIPPLDYDLALAMKRRRPDLSISVNGGIATLAEAEAFLEAGFDGVMIGRAAYHDPAAVLIGADARIFGDHGVQRTAEDAVRDMVPYIERHIAAGGRLAQVTRHMLGLFQGRPGARRWRRILSEEGHRDGADTRVLLKALAAIPPAEAAA